MGVLRDLVFGDEINKMKREIQRLKDRVEELELEKKQFHDYVVEKMECIENNFADQIAEKCYVRSVDEDNLLYLLREIRKHKRGRVKNETTK